MLVLDASQWRGPTGSWRLSWLGYEPQDARLRRLGRSPVTALASAALPREVLPGPARLWRTGVSRRVRARIRAQAGFLTCGFPLSPSARPRALVPIGLSCHRRPARAGSGPGPGGRCCSPRSRPRSPPWSRTRPWTAARTPAIHVTSRPVPGHHGGGIRAGEPNAGSPGRKGPGRCAQNAGWASVDLTAPKVSGPCGSAWPSAMSREVCMTEPVVAGRTGGSATARNGMRQGPGDPPVVLVAAFGLCSSGHAGVR
jgi:hypothetical protein